MHKGAFVMITGAVDPDANLVTAIKKLGGRAMLAPSITIKQFPLRPREKKLLRSTARYDWILFTSKHAVDFFIAELRREKVRLLPQRPRIAVVGPETAHALGKVGIAIDVIPAKASVEELIKKLGTKIQGKRILFPRSAIAPYDAIRTLRGRGALVNPISLYTTVPVKILPVALKKIERGSVDYLIFMSPSGVHGFMKNRLQNRMAMRQIPALCIGPTTAAVARGARFAKIYTAKSPTPTGIIDLLRKLP